MKAGALRAIAVTGATRFSPMPDTPTFTELGYPDFLASVWYGLLVKTGTSADITAKIIEAAKAAHADPKVRAALDPLGLDVVAVTGPALPKAIHEAADRWAAIVKKTGFKASE
jgi:tripartite-type tricarboxylate transporter receptor subunit TctC